MTTLDLRNIQTLIDLQSALARFASGAQEALRPVEPEINRTLEWLRERINYWRREVERARQAVARAEADFQRCQARGFRDMDGRYYPPDCSRERQALAQALARSHECESNLQAAQVWRSRVEQTADEYRREARRLSDLASGHTEKAQAFLGRAAEKYEEVKSAASGVGGVGMVLSGLIGLAQQRGGAAEQSATWTEHRAILKRIEAGEKITLDDMKRLSLPISDLQTGSQQEDTSWIQSLIDGERYLEAMGDSGEAQDLREAILATLKAMNYWRS